ncbi:MAG: hypothetical protein OXK79_10790 [Chloroflexota bacterium]|nr:hypothetical protein [Chloroflexota bacterium]
MKLAANSFQYTWPRTTRFRARALNSGHRSTLCFSIASDSMVDVAHALADTAGAARIFYVNNNPLIAGPGHPVIAAALERSTVLLLAASKANSC